MNIEIPISVGELVDKLTILEIKKEKIKDTNKLININNEYDKLSKLETKLKNKNEEEYTKLFNELKTINLKLWEIEDKIRILESETKFNEEFVELARSVYFTNDERFESKNKINKYFGSEFAEEKQYIEYK
ncbi:MAG: hypothetical protein CBE33_01090 [Candidatus Pelagibacter sp. TMED273]|nr:MAG: hypothetical protein CBE33_01090 [Candidatus Pelagibacter sp. TMED273]|tara:strand:- start:5001 stop:5393 length:393 start_codon:yes stop_codon:yes gene_type:complete